MSGLIVRQQSELPAKPDELAKFLILAQEKVKSVQAEIRAIQRLDIARVVYVQKLEERRQLQELILRAYQRIGEITRKLPKSAGGRPSAKTSKNGFKTKAQIIHDLGLSTSQVGRMEQVAAHPDIVEEVFAESQAGEIEATVAEVLRRIKKRNDTANVEKNHQNNANLKLFRRVTSYRNLPKITDDVLDDIVASSRTLCVELDKLSETIRRLSDIREQLLEKGQIASRQLFESIALKEELEPLLEIMD